MTPEATLIVHLDGGREQAQRCLAALAALAPTPSFEAIIVDDATPDLAPLLAGLEGDVEVLRNERREGFLAAARRAAGVARADTLVLLYEAPEPAPDALGPLLATLADPGCAAAAAAMPEAPSAHPTATRVLALRRADAALLAGATGAAAGLELAAICTELARAGRVTTVPEARAAAGRRVVSGRARPGARAELTIVVPTLDAASPRVAGCLAAIAANTQVPHQVVVIDNGAPPQGFTGPVNAGLRAVDTPYAVVMNDDVEPLPGWWGPLGAALDGGEAVVFPLTVEGGMRADFAAWCFALTADSLSTAAHAPGEFFDPAMSIWFQDTDLLLRLRGAGRPPRLVRSSEIRHGLSATVRSEDPELRTWIETTIAADRAAFERKWPGKLPRRP